MVLNFGYQNWVLKFVTESFNVSSKFGQQILSTDMWSLNHLVLPFRNQSTSQKKIIHSWIILMPFVILSIPVTNRNQYQFLKLYYLHSLPGVSGYFYLHQLISFTRTQQFSATLDQQLESHSPKKILVGKYKLHSKHHGKYAQSQF